MTTAAVYQPLTASEHSGQLRKAVIASTVGAHLRPHRAQEDVTDRGCNGRSVWVPLFRYGRHRDTVGGFIAIVLSLIPHDMQYGPQAALIAEAFTPRLRYSGSWLGYQLASIIVGGPVPLRPRCSPLTGPAMR